MAPGGRVRIVTDQVLALVGDVLGDFSDEVQRLEHLKIFGMCHRISRRWPALLMPYVRTTDAFRCSVEFINIPVNTYVANNVFWGATNRGQCIPDAPFLPDPSQVDNIAQPDSVVMFHESTRDWSGSLSNWISGNDLKWWGEYRGNFHYVTTNRNA